MADLEGFRHHFWNLREICVRKAVLEFGRISGAHSLAFPIQKLSQIFKFAFARHRILEYKCGQRLDM